MDNYDECPPSTDILNSIRARRTTFHSWAGEALDNSIDAGARVIALIMSNERLACVDDGRGIEKKYDRASVQIAQHGDMETTKLGRFGVGMKYKAIQHGNILKIVSVSADGKMVRTVDWKKLQESGKWLYPHPHRRPSSAKFGTVVTIEELFKPPKPADILKARTEIQRRYYPAIDSGVVITLNDEIVTSVAMPALRDTIEDERRFPGGRSARIYGGMLVDSANSRLRQVDVAVAYRIIKPDSGFGCGSYGGVRSMFARLELLGPWKLTDFKDDIADDPYEEELEEWVEKVLKPVLEKCQSASMTFKAEKMEQRLNDMLPEAQRATRPVQKQKLGRSGEKKGTKNGSENEKSKENSTGPTKKKNPPRGTFIEFADNLCDEFGYGRAEFGKSSTRIQLATDCPYIQMLMNHHHEDIAAAALFTIASLIYEGDRQLADPILPGIERPTGLRAWELGRQQELPIKEAAE